MPIPFPRPVEDLKPVQWVVVTPDSLPDGEWVLYALDRRGYENLSLNWAEAIRWAKEAHTALKLAIEGVATGNSGVVDEERENDNHVRD